ncbi:MAG TPA: SpoIIE family protein phosphatase [Patescibacteria group bacterium]|nr:SpoIIE family protein phosphatase [Patescibacteria group bacterium]
MIHEFPDGLLIGAIDGLGHGPEAAVAARLCAGMLSDYSGEPLVQTIAKCHAALRGTRGVALSLCTLDAKSSFWAWAGVGNVAGVLLRQSGGPTRQREFLIQRNGVVGGRMTKPTVSRTHAAPGDVMTLATDGIRADYSLGMDLTGTPQKIAERIMDGYATGKDDALVLVARYEGRPS